MFDITVVSDTYEIKGIVGVYLITEMYEPGRMAKGVFENPNTITLLAYSPMGWAMQHEVPSIGTVISVFVRESFRNQGVGTSLVNELMRHPNACHSCFYSVEAKGFFNRLFTEKNDALETT